MTLGGYMMLGIGLAALAAAGMILNRRGGSAAAVYRGRIAGVMLGAGGLALVVFALGFAAISAEG